MSDVAALVLSAEVTKRCWGCRTHLPHDAFGILRSSKDGRRPICKVCDARKHRELKSLPDTHPRRVKELARFRKYYHKNKQQYAAKQRQRNLARKYGLTEEAFDELLLEQGGRCAICQTNNFGKNGPCVDHCHRTGEIRGILCGSCNRGIGWLKDNPAYLRAGAEYLERPRGRRR